VLIVADDAHDRAVAVDIRLTVIVALDVLELPP
jgi:hypothetical protein